MSSELPADAAAAWLHDRMAEQLRARRDLFLGDYSVADRPALVLQAIPLEAAEPVDVRAPALAKAMRREGLNPQFAWWRQFASSGGAKAVFDGVAINATGSSDGWATELHTDGHLIAGVWEFPDTGSGGVAVAEFYDHVFADFAALAVSVYQVASVSGRLAATCTLLQATKLPLLGKRGQQQVAPAPKRDKLEWPMVQVASVNGLEAAFAEMKTRFHRAYGFFTFD
ncbi:MAG: hypothetical protein M3N82_04875 [Pseudomonadota bacterium]|nr:hypothetical protein [Pseudomonadota bacterium]